jgi:hypothetical protein
VKNKLKKKPRTHKPFSKSLGLEFLTMEIRRPVTPRSTKNVPDNFNTISSILFSFYENDVSYTVHTQAIKNITAPNKLKKKESVHIIFSKYDGLLSLIM